MDRELVRRKLVGSRNAARRAIEAGQVSVGGVASPKASTLVAPTDPLHLTDESARFVGRGGQKLDGGLDAFAIDVTDRRALDAGASTGGFTDCLLQRGARSVVALDVGYGQLHWSLRTDPRVEVIDRTNVRYVEPAAIGAPFDVVVADLSFISLTLVAPVLAACGHAATDWMVLVKPQFEVGAGHVPAGGVVGDAGAHADAVDAVAAAFRVHDVQSQGVVASSLRGAAGNREFLLWLRRDRPGVDPADLRAQVEEGT